MQLFSSHILQSVFVRMKQHVIYVPIMRSAFIKGDIMATVLHSVILHVCEETSCHFSNQR